MEPRLFVREDMSAELVLPFAGGRVAVYSARGPEKSGPNEDAALVHAVGRAAGVLAVADGLGGQPGGANAADTALACLARAVARRAEADAGEAWLRAAVLDGLEEANRGVLDLGIGAAATLAVVEIGGGRARVYHVGDAAALVVGQRGRLKLQTVQHSPVGYAVESGMLDAAEALHHEERHLVSNMVGAPDMRIEVGSPLALAARDTLVVASDGLFDNLGIEEIVALVRKGPLEECAGALAQTARQRMLEPGEGHPSKPDDLTFLLFRPSG